MQKQLALFIVFLTSILTAASVYAGSVYYVQSDNANIRAQPSFGAKVIGKVAKGQTLAFLSKNGNWIKVKIDSKEGYISSLLVADHAPLARPTITKSTEDADVKPTARRRASSFTSAAAARGLTDEEKNREGVEDKSNYKAVDQMESVKVTPEEVKKFKESGK